MNLQEGLGLPTCLLTRAWVPLPRAEQAVGCSSGSQASCA